METLTPTLRDRLLCLVGWHGPNVLGNDSCDRSARVRGFVRECLFCGARWHGQQVDTRYMRTLGNWQRYRGDE